MHPLLKKNPGSAPGNSLYCGLDNREIDKLQRVQNCAARLVSGIRRCDLITPVMNMASDRGQNRYSDSTRLDSACSDLLFNAKLN